MLTKWRIYDAILLVALAIAYHLAWYIKPFQRQFYINDLTISHPFAEHERVTNNELFLYAGVFPSILIAATAPIVSEPGKRLHSTYIALLGLFLGLFATSVFTDVMKNYIGRLRPDFLARCIPKAGTLENVLVNASDVCTTSNLPRLLDGFRTTPSGHSSLSFAGLLYASLYLGRILHVKAGADAWRTLVAGLPTVGAAIIALTRTQDYRHHFVDVFVGMLVGVGIGGWSFWRLGEEKEYEEVSGEVQEGV